jgi:hypothetical protein
MKMKTNYTIVAAILLAGLSSAAAADFYYGQNFDSMGTTGTTAPLGWSFWHIDGNSSSTLAPTSAEMATAVPGLTTLAIWNQTSISDWFDQGVNMGSTPTDSNRLLGTSPTGTRGSILQLSLNNNSGAAITSIRLTYDMKSMAEGVSAGAEFPSTDELPGYRFYYLDGSIWTPVPGLDLANDTVNSVGHADAIITFATPVDDGGTMQFRWFDDNAFSHSPDTMYALDNLNIPEPTTLSLLAIGALALIFRRRKA